MVYIIILCCNYFMQCRDPLAYQERVITKKEGRGKEREVPMQQIKNLNFSHSSCVTIFRPP